MPSSLTKQLCGLSLASLIGISTSSIASDTKTILNKNTPVQNSTVQHTPINIEITTHLGDQQTFLKGDTISFFLNLDQDAYILVIFVDAKGNRFQIIPNKYQSHHLYKAGLFIAIPPQGAAYRFKVSAPYGHENLWVFSSDKAISSHKGKQLNNGLKQLTDTIATLRESIKKQSIEKYGEAHLTINTMASH